MDFELTKEHQMFQTAVRNFCKKEMDPIVDEWEEKGEFPRNILLPKAGAFGYNCLRAPEKYGGAGADKISEVIINEEVARISLGFAESFCLGSNYVVPLIWTRGTEVQCQKYLPPTIQGKWMGAYALTEQSGGSDPSTRKTSAVRKANKWIVNGSNIFITNGSICDYQLILAVTDRAKGTHGMTHFLIDWPMTGWSRKKLQKMGSRTSDEAEIFYDDLEIPSENQLGEEGRGYADTLWLVGANRIPHAARSLGCAEGAFDLALPYTKERNVWGKPIIKHQSLTFKFAEMATQIEAARLMVHKAAWLFEKKNPEWVRFAAMAKLTAAEVNRRVARDCLEVFGCYGLMSEHRAQRYFRDSQYLPITEGSHEILKIVISQPWTR
jgi:alkylation response protein AidB-like acyl-CoA dehydrogenase